MEIKELIQKLENITGKYELKILYLDFTDVTLISRIGFSEDVFIQIYVNAEKEKTNMALIVAGERIYGIDNEGGFYHEHPFENPSFHSDTEQTGIEDFILKAFEYLRRIGLI